jgi:hypothetical protein
LKAQIKTILIGPSGNPVRRLRQKNLPNLKFREKDSSKSFNENLILNESN